MARSFVLLLLVLAQINSVVSQDALLDLIPAHARGGKLWENKKRDVESSEVYTNSTPNVFWQKIDQAGAYDSAKFSQRWYVDESYCTGSARATCPMYLYIGGEATLTGTPGGYVSTMAQEQGALIFALEHRWYGESMPGDITSTEDLASLTVENAISDIAQFQDYQEQVTGSMGSRKWLLIGGSYPGALSTWYRVQYPLSVSAIASWSSSGVILAVENFTQFDEIETQVLGDECAQAVRDVTSAFESSWDAGGDVKQSMLDMFHTPSDFTKGDMAWMLADSAAMGPQYGYTSELCSYLVPGKPQGDTLLASFANWTNTHYGVNFGSSCYYSTACLANPERVNEWYNTKSWIWQCCHQLEYWQVAYPNSLRSSSLTFEYFENQCKANVVEFNMKYGGLHPNVTQVIATNGLEDPWRGATQNKTNSATYPQSTAMCDSCGHCGDLHSLTDASPDAMAEQQALIKQYLDEWMYAV